MSRVLGDDWMLPLLDDTNRAWFQSEDGRLRLRACADCGAVQHPPDEVCGSCQATRFTTRASQGQGRIVSAAVVHHPVHPALADRVPYAICVVALDDLPAAHVVGNLVDAAPGDARIGALVEVAFEEAVVDGEAIRIPQWRLREG